MHKIKYTVLLVAVLSVLFGCDILDKDKTSHPNEGGINLDIDWSKTTGQSAPALKARFMAATGSIQDFHINGNNNLLVVKPGEGTLYVFNEAEHVTVTGIKANVSSNQNPGMFYSYYGQVFTERDQDIDHTAVMTQQTGEVKISLAIKPASIISKVKTVSAVLEGMYSELDMQTNKLSTPVSTSFGLSKSAYFATALIRTLGFDSSTKQLIKFEIEMENGSRANVTSDLTSLVSGFNQAKNTLLAINAELFVSGETNPVATVDKWECNTEIQYLSVMPAEIELVNQASGDVIEVITDQSSWTYHISSNGDWLTATQSETQLTIAATANNNNTSREATIRISAGGLNESVTVRQNPTTSTTYADKETVKLQSATIGKGVNIIVMGDGYTIQDMNRGTGKYERDMRAAADHFFSVYPYSAYRNYFNVYMVAAISNQAGISNKSTNTTVDNKFQTIWEGGRSTGIDCDDDIVIEYVDAIDELEYAYLHDLTVILPINANIYAGTCRMWITYQDFANGFSIGMCPVGSDFKEVVMHEAGGHGFAKLNDEYIYNHDQTIPDDDQEDVILYKKYGALENVDLFSDILLTSWKGFAGLPKYNMVSTFEGAATYGKGIWRPEYNSCMNNNVPYFNAPSRWAIVRRIMRLAGFNYSFAQFLQDDIVPVYPTSARRYDDKSFVPLAPPKVSLGEIQRRR